MSVYRRVGYRYPTLQANARHANHATQFWRDPSRSIVSPMRGWDTGIPPRYLLSGTREAFTGFVTTEEGRACRS
jgi:hypothetical protein